MKRSPVESPLIRSFRELLGVGLNPPEDELKKAYRRMVLLYHPDKNLGKDSTEDQFLRVTEAYETLSDSKKIEQANKSYLEKKLFDFPIEGLNVSFGSFFGYRKFVLKRVERSKRIGRERSGEADAEVGYYDLSYSQDSQSILDNPAFDSIELVYAGKFSLGDEERMMSGFKGRDLGQLPWVVLNNRGIIYFLEGKFKDSMKCYEELNDRVPNNIIFLYRLGLCEAILSFKNAKRSLFGPKPETTSFKKAVEHLRRAIALGETRTIGKQKCLMIRKTLADIFEKAGQIKNSKRIWEEIRLIDPRSPEAALKLGSPLKFLKKSER